MVIKVFSGLLKSKLSLVKRFLRLRKVDSRPNDGKGFLAGTLDGKGEPRIRFRSGQERRSMTSVVTHRCFDGPARHTTVTIFGGST